LIGKAFFHIDEGDLVLESGVFVFDIFDLSYLSERDVTMAGQSLV